jgi:serine-type D-Ala-D-Ala carboxypeptidase (penicillin-binding protein 5/6)
VLLLLAIAVPWRLASESPPPLVVHRTLAAYVRVPGTAPALAWPREGQAAVEVEGVGSGGTSGGHAPVPIASVAKVMTAYLILLDHPLRAHERGFVISITPAEVQEERQRAALGESTLAVRAGEQITERQALEALLLPSANNIAELLAVHDAGTLASFVARMNNTARKLGMLSTTYTDPSGFDDETVSTAADQLKLARMAMREPAFAAIVDEPSAELPGVGRVANFNGLVENDGYVGVKTGSDRAAGGCLVFAKRVAIAGRRLTVLGVVLGQREGPLIESALHSAEALGDSAAAALRVETVVPTGTSVLVVKNADGIGATAVTATALQEIGWPGLALAIRVTARPAMRRLRAGEQVATVAVVGASAATTGAVASRSLGGPSLGWRIGHLL